MSLVEERTDYYRNFIDKRRQNGDPAKIFYPTPESADEVASLIVAGGVVAMPWGAECRRTMILVCCYDIPEATRFMNEIKGRSERQVLAIGCLTEDVSNYAAIEESRPLVNAARKRYSVDQPTETNLKRVLDELFDKHSVGLKLKAKPSLPDAVTSLTPLGRTVLVLGAHTSDINDIYNPVIWILSKKHGKAVAGTSGQKTHGEPCNSVASQEKLLSEIGFSVDGFVKLPRIPAKSPKPGKAASSTTFDLTGEEVILMRWGNEHPLRFREIFPEVIIPKSVAKELHAESLRSFVLGSLREAIGLLD